MQYIANLINNWSNEPAKLSNILAKRFNADIISNIMLYLSKYDIERLSGQLSTFNMICGSTYDTDLFIKLYNKNYYTCNIFGNGPILLNSAAKSGNIELIKWMQKHGFKFTEQTILSAVGNSELVKWLYENDYLYHSDKLCKKIVMSGDLNLLIWLHERNVTNQSICNYAAQAGHLYILIWAIDEGYHFNAEKLLHHAVVGRNFHIMKWLCDNEFLSKDIEYNMKYDRATIDWLISIGLIINMH